jgi:hypothetical protein
MPVAKRVGSYEKYVRGGVRGMNETSQPWLRADPRRRLAPTPYVVYNDECPGPADCAGRVTWCGFPL